MLAIYLLLIFVILVLGYLPFKSKKNTVNTTFLGISIFISGWIFSNYWIWNSEDFLFWNRMAYLGATPVAVLILYFVLNYPKKIYSFSKLKLALFFAVPTVLMVLSPTEFIVKNMTSITNVEFGVGNNIWGAYFFLYMITVFVVSFKGIRNYKGLEKLKLQYFLIGLFSFISLAL